MGYKPKFITYASDNFEKIFEITLQLIKKGKAFVCKLSKAESKKCKELKEPSPYRNNTPE